MSFIPINKYQVFEYFKKLIVFHFHITLHHYVGITQNENQNEYIARILRLILAMNSFERDREAIGVN